PALTTLVPNRMFRNAGGKKFEEVTTSGGFGHLQKGHGVAFGDIDHDGDQDIYVTMGGAMEGDTFANLLFENPAEDSRFITLELEGTKSSRDALNARVAIQLTTPDGPRTLFRTVGTGGSFGASSVQLEVGLGNATGVDSVEVTWPVTGVQRYEGLERNRRYRLREGDAQAAPLEVPGSTDEH
ncbi:MAG: CRTAC1 family protein, partial [Planctomycetota bacterium]